MTTLLLVTDVDATLIQQEVIELIARRAGTLDEVAAVTSRAMRGEIDFTQSLRHRVATLEGLPARVLGDVIAEVHPTPGAERLIDAVHEAGGVVGAVSGGFTQVLGPLADRLGVDLWRANELEIRDGRLTGRVIGPIVDGERKRASLVEWAASLGVPRERTVAIGDGANDIRMVHEAAVGIAYRPKPALREAADVSIDQIGLDHAIPCALSVLGTEPGAVSAPSPGRHRRE